MSNIIGIRVARLRHIIKLDAPSMVVVAARRLAHKAIDDFCDDADDIFTLRDAKEKVLLLSSARAKLHKEVEDIK